jgi:hypothetical protein
MRLATPSGALSTDHWWQIKPARASAIAALATAGIVAHAILRWGAHASPFVAAIELIDLAAVLNALRAAVPGGELSDY